MSYPFVMQTKGHIKMRLVGATHGSRIQTSARVGRCAINMGVPAVVLLVREQTMTTILRGIYDSPFLSSLRRARARERTRRRACKWGP